MPQFNICRILYCTQTLWIDTQRFGVAKTFSVCFSVENFILLLCIWQLICSHFKWDFSVSVVTEIIIMIKAKRMEILVFRKTIDLASILVWDVRWATNYGGFDRFSMTTNECEFCVVISEDNGIACIVHYIFIQTCYVIRPILWHFRNLIAQWLVFSSGRCLKYLTESFCLWFSKAPFHLSSYSRNNKQTKTKRTFICIMKMKSMRKLSNSFEIKSKWIVFSLCFYDRQFIIYCLPNYKSIVHQKKNIYENRILQAVWCSFLDWKSSNSNTKHCKHNGYMFEMKNDYEHQCQTLKVVIYTI